MKTSHWKAYSPIGGVTAFDAEQAGPYIGAVDVMANLSPNQHYPECRIVVGLVSVGAISMTVQQSAELRAQLERAEHDVTAVPREEQANG